MPTVFTLEILGRTWGDATMMEADGISRRAFLGGVSGAGMLLCLGATGGRVEAMAEDMGLPLERIDCTQDYPPDRYFANGATQVIETGAGRYRETAGEFGSRFGYRFRIEEIGKPHVAIVRYPDDKRRSMCLMDSTTYDLSTGVLTGWAQPLSGQMIELRQVFWPRWNDCTLTFMTWGAGEPAAASSIEIRRLETLPALPPPEGGGPGFREVGIQYEDPCGTGAAEGASNHQEWIDRVVEYARYTGQGLLVYPIAWYHGPLFPSKREPAGALDLVAAPDRKLYLRWTTQPEDWYATLLERFGREGLSFQGSMTLMRLGTLLQRMNTDIESIRQGTDTINNMLWNDRVQGSTSDWTPLYNVRNFDAAVQELKTKDKLEPFSAIQKFAYGETPDPANPMGPIFNPLHPVVQEAIVGFVREIGERYASYPAFKGVSFNMFASCMPWFGSLRSGYDDLSVSLFEHETGISVPADPKAPDRFSKRYEFLTHVCRPAWVAWRCKKIRALLGKVHEALAESRPDLRVVVTLWDETSLGAMIGGAGAARQLYARQNSLQLFREAGIDPTLYCDEPGLEVDVPTGNPRDRGSSNEGLNMSLESSCFFRDADFLDAESLDAYRAQPKSGTFIFNCWVEAWGKHVWFSPEPNDPNLPTVSMMDGKPAEGILRINSEYPNDGFWWEDQTRITPQFPAGEHFLEPYAHAVAELDACRITRGGLFLDKAHSEAIQRFTRAYRTLPDAKFETVGTSTDPVALRTLARDGKRYLYAVNRDYYPVQAELSFSVQNCTLHDLSSGEDLTASPTLQLNLGPYELRTFTLDPNVTPAGLKTAIPAEIATTMKADAESTLAAFAEVRRLDLQIPGMDEFEGRIQAALREERCAWLRRALTGYVARKCREIAANPSASVLPQKDA